MIIFFAGHDMVMVLVKPGNGLMDSQAPTQNSMIMMIIIIYENI